MEKSLISFTCFIGIDVSKLTIDVTLLNPGKAVKKYKQFTNTPSGMRLLNSWLRKIDEFKYPGSVFCMEHTGIYTRTLLDFLIGKKANVWMESSLQIKKSLGLNRGKNDQIDSLRIAEYSYRFIDKAVLAVNNSPELILLKDLLTSRDRLKKSLRSIQVAIKELTRIDAKQGKTLELLNLQALRGLKNSIQQIEKQMLEEVLKKKEFAEYYKLMISIPGVGSILAIKLIVYTKAFTRFNNVRQLACYCGVAPFEHRSGTSVRGKTGVSKFANMDLKSTLHLASISAIQHNPELKKYYLRKVEEGKSKMSVINAVRNKLLARVVAVINRKTPYVQSLAMAG
jgi:transposase